MLRDLCSRVEEAYDRPVVTVGLITVLGGLLRLFHLGFKPLWLDEAVIYWISNSGSVGNIITANASGNSAPPLFAILVGLMLNIGHSESVLRLIPFLAGVAAIPAVYFLSRQLLQKTPAYFSALVVAIAPTQVQYSQQLREYSLTVLTASIMLALFCKQIRRPTWSNWALMIVVMGLGIFLQYGLALLVAALDVIWVGLLWSPRSGRKLRLVSWGLAQIVLLSIVVAVYCLSLKEQVRVGFGTGPTSGYLAGAYWSGSWRNLLRLAVFNTLDIVDFAFAGSLFLFLAAAGVYAALKTKDGRTALVLCVAPAVLTFGLASAKLFPYHGARHDIFLVPMIYVLGGFGFAQLLCETGRRWVGLLLVLVTVLVGLRAVYSYSFDRGQEDIRPVVTTLSSGYMDGDMIYVYYGAQPAFRYYYRDNIDAHIYGTSNRGDVNSYFDEIDDVLVTGSRVWMVFSHCYGDECEVIPMHVCRTREVDVAARGNGTWLYLVSQAQ